MVQILEYFGDKIVKNTTNLLS